MRIHIAAESRPDESRVAGVPESVERLKKFGHEVTIEAGAGERAGFPDDAYRDAGAEVVTDAAAAWQAADAVFKVRPPSDDENGQLRRGVVLACYLRPATSPELLQKLADAGVTALALDAVPRTSKAQAMDTLSAMANIAGYRAIIEASNVFGRFFSGQMTAAGRLPPAKVLVIGAGVAGLSAVGTAKNLGAIVRAFDTRAATKDQVESLGGEFLTVEMEEAGEGAGGYAKQMSQAFLDAEYALFREQAEEVDIVVTTALVPGKPAPKLWLKDMVDRMKPGSVVVDLAAEQGGNCEYTQKDQAVDANGVTVLGYLNLPGRMANTSSSLYANVLVNLIKHLGGADAAVDMEEEVTRAIAVTHDGAVTWPPPAPPAPPPEPAKPAPPAPVAAEPEAPAKPRSYDGLMMAVGVLLAIGWAWLRFGGDASAAAGQEVQDFVQHLTVFVLACFIGYQVIWNVTPALHTPLMAVTNAISGIIILGGLLQGGAIAPATEDGAGGLTVAATLGLAAILLAMINVAGGFLVTHRMLAMFRKD